MIREKNTGPIRQTTRRGCQVQTNMYNKNRSSNCHLHIWIQNNKNIQTGKNKPGNGLTVLQTSRPMKFEKSIAKFRFVYTIRLSVANMYSIKGTGHDIC